ncbi:MAG: response regulator transcription factor, partial [Bacteroidales bacterium]|nr:response regulator transcription factor [Bacteroidales bacterium]
MNPSNYKILLVDDEDDVLEFLSYNLRKEGFRVITASNGTDGVVKAIEELPHLIILDVMMPEMDGMATCEKIREISALKNSLIVFLTARAEDYSQIAGFDAGADDYVSKPIKPKLLISRVKALLRRIQEDKQESTTVAIKDFIIDSERFLVINNGVEIV